MVALKQYLLWLNLGIMLLVLIFSRMMDNAPILFASTKVNIAYSEANQSEQEPENVTIAADKMNSFYIGVDNPITVVGTALDQDLKVRAARGSIKRRGKGKYIVNPRRLGMDTIIVTNIKTQKKQYFPFRVQRIPTAVVTLGGKTDGIMGSGEMASQRKLVARYPNTPYDATAKVTSFELYYTQKGKDPQRFEGRGGVFDKNILQAIQSAKPGDQYAFVNVRVRAVATGVAVGYNGLAFKIR